MSAAVKTVIRQPITVVINELVDIKMPTQSAATDEVGNQLLTTTNVDDGRVAVKDYAPVLAKDGWRELVPGYYMSHDGMQSYGKYFRLFVRSQPVEKYIARKRSDDDHLEWSSQKIAPEACKISNSDRGAQPTMGEPIADSASAPTALHCGPQLPELADFVSYNSLARARSSRDSLLIGFDSEWISHEQDSAPRLMTDMLSWQFAVVYGSILYEFIFMRIANKGLNLELALGRILDHLGIAKPVDARTVRRYDACSEWKDGSPVVCTYETWKEACAHAKYIYGDGHFWQTLIKEMPMNEKKSPRCSRDWAWFHARFDWRDIHKINVTLICHAGKVDLSALDQSGKNRWDVLKRCSEVQGGLVMLDDSFLTIKSVHPDKVKNRLEYLYPVVLSVADTMCHAPTGKKSLADLGKVLNIPKIDIPISQKSCMDQLLLADPKLYFNYASTDSVVTLLYASALYGYNKSMPVTVTSAAARVMREDMMNYLGCSNKNEFNEVYRGLAKVSHGLAPREDRPGFIESSSLEPISDKANTVQHYSSMAYHGGYNGCFDVGYFDGLTFDYDLENAYPTAMCVVQDIDWDNPIRVHIENRYLSLQDWFVGGSVFNPLMPFFAYVRFEFPQDVLYPCIPVNVDGIPVFPRTSKGLNGVYAAGPEIFLALKLGAKVWCETGYFLNVRLHSDEFGHYSESTSLRYAVMQLVKDRAQAKHDHGKGSLEELILKVMVNAGYGKNAQNVVQKQTWTAFRDCMEDLGCSAITNPVSACMITSIVRAELLAAQNQAHDLGYKVVSVTTDGFISDMPEKILKSLDLHGFRPFMEKARLFLTDGKDPEIWAIKHVMDDLINFTTRGNVSLHDYDSVTKTGKNPMVFEECMYPGVCAHNSTKSGFASDSYEDRLWLMTKVLSRTGTVDYVDKEWTGFKDLVKGNPFTVTTHVRHIRMDFDMKRKPDRHSFYTTHPVIDGMTYEIANFSTVPFETVDEFRLYRAKKKLCVCLRTEKEWEQFFLKVDLDGCGCRTTDLEWAVLKSCIMGHRCGKWYIPGLDNKSVDERCEWINSHNTSSHIFKPNDWKDCRKPSRIVNMLPDKFLLEKLDELMSDI